MAEICPPLGVEAESKDKSFPWTFYYNKILYPHCSCGIASKHVDEDTEEWGC